MTGLMEMLMAPGGAERTAVKYGDLMWRCGLELGTVVDTASPFWMIGAKKNQHK